MKKLLALMLAVLLILGVFTACTPQSEPSSTPTPAAKTPASSTPTAQDDLEPQQNLAVAEGGTFTLPIVDGTKNFNIWITFAADHMKDLNESLAYQTIEERTGIHIDWYCTSSASAGESFQLAIASGDYADSYIYNIGGLIYGQDYYVENDIVVNLEPFIADYAPNYDYVRNLTDNTRIATLSDSGLCVAFYKIMQNLQWSYFGPIGRYDWLDGIGKSVPETYDQLEEVLTGFRDNYSPDAPLALMPSGIDDWLLAGFDTMYSTAATGNVFIQKNGKAAFGAAEPGFREYIQLMSDWYSQGLIDRDFYSETGYPGLNSELVLNGKIGVAISLYTYPDFFEKNAASAGDTAFQWRGFKCPVKNVGDTRKVVMGGGLLYYRGNLCSFVTTACDDLESMMRWYDYFYTVDGATVCSYGVEGVSFEYDNSGTPQFKELVYNNPEGLSLNNAIAKYACIPAQASWYNWQRELVPGTSENVWNTKELFDGNWKDEYTMPQISMTREESAEYGTIISDINTYVAENIVKFISGQRPMSEFDDMINTLNGMKLDRATELQQAALDRYYARG